MKLKLAQRFLIGYYKTKLKTIGMVSPRKAAEAAFELFCTPYGGRLKTHTPAIFQSAEKLSFVLDSLNIHGFRWSSQHPNGKKILIVHGFRSSSYKFEKYVTPLLNEGFEVLAFDAPAHGLSDGELINAAVYTRSIQEIENLYGPLYGIMGHSLGGLAAALAFESFPDNANRKLVVIAPATETERTIADFFRLVPVTDKVKTAFTELVEEIVGKPVHYFSVSRVIKNIHAPVLWVHDKQDPICPFKDVEPLLSLPLPHVKFLITEHLGHSKVYKDNAVCTQIIRFFHPKNT